MIRQLTLSEAAALSALDQAAFADFWSAASWANELQRGLVLGYFMGDQLVGAVSFQTILDESELYKIMVHPAYRQQGIARQLMMAGMEILRTRQVARLFLEVAEKNRPALALYQAFGFTRCGFRANYYENPPDNALLMELSL